MTRITKKRITKTSQRKTVRKNYRGSGIGIQDFFGKIFRRKKTQNQFQTNTQPQVEKSKQSQKPTVTIKNSGLISIGVKNEHLQLIPGYIKLPQIRTILSNKNLDPWKKTEMLLAQFFYNYSQNKTGEDVIKDFDNNRQELKGKVLERIGYIKTILEEINANTLYQDSHYKGLFNNYTKPNKQSYKYKTFKQNLEFLLHTLSIAAKKYFPDITIPNNNTKLTNNNLENIALTNFEKILKEPRNQKLYENLKEIRRLYNNMNTNVYNIDEVKEIIKLYNIKDDNGNIVKIDDTINTRDILNLIFIERSRLMLLINQVKYHFEAIKTKTYERKLFIANMTFLEDVLGKIRKLITDPK
jgi:hypothetical protein